jgi:hypothetical protein
VPDPIQFTYRWSRRLGFQTRRHRGNVPAVIARYVPPRRRKSLQKSKAAQEAAFCWTGFARTRLLMIHLALTFHLIVLLHHFLPHLLPFGLLVGRQDGVELLDGRLMELLHLRLLIRRG